MALGHVFVSCVDILLIVCMMMIPTISLRAVSISGSVEGDMLMSDKLVVEFTVSADVIVSNNGHASMEST